MLYRFADQAALDAWESSPQRAWWLGSAQGLVGESRVERRTGIEGWFDEPDVVDVEDLRPPAPAPPRWKQGVVIWLTFFPLSLALGCCCLTGLDLNIVVRTFLTTLVATPIMTYGLLPWMTRRFEWWLKPAADSHSPNGYGSGHRPRRQRCRRHGARSASVSTSTSRRASRTRAAARTPPRRSPPAR